MDEVIGTFAMLGLIGIVVFGVANCFDKQMFHREACEWRLKNAPTLADTVAVAAADDFCWSEVRKRGSN